MPDELTLRQLNRTTLQRQLLLRRSDQNPFDVVHHLVGMQAQLPLNPYVALWSRLDGFSTDELSKLLVDRRLVRIVVMRGTIHLVTADDALLLRPLTQPVHDAALARRREFDDVDLDAVVAYIRARLAEAPSTGPQLRDLLAEQFPAHDSADLLFACKIRLPLVQVPPRGVWGQSMQVTLATVESWLGRPMLSGEDARRAIDDVVLRYLAAFGPASVADIASWSRLTGQREVVQRLGERLRRYTGPGGRELFDIADATIADPETPAPVRFLPEYDNVLLSHADRSRFIPDERRAQLMSMTAPVRGTVMHDGFVTGAWHVERDGTKGPATLIVRHVDRLSGTTTDEIEAEALQLLGLIAAETSEHAVRFVPVPARP